MKILLAIDSSEYIEEVTLMRSVTVDSIKASETRGNPSG
jgi:hypothetical protein